MMKTVISLLSIFAFSKHVENAVATCSEALMASSQGHACDNAGGIAGLKSDRRFLRQSERMTMKEEVEKEKETEYVYIYSGRLPYHPFLSLMYCQSFRSFIAPVCCSVEEAESDTPENEAEKEKYVPRRFRP
jgi:hypothetical protein